MEQENPYSTPLASKSVSHPIGGLKYVRQVKPLCICMMIQGVLEIIAGLFFAAMVFIVPGIITNNPNGPQIPEEQARLMFGLIYGSVGAVATCVGILRCYAGWQGFNFRRHGLGFASHFLGLLSMVTCYCLPTALGLCVWGCIVYTKPEVKNAFRLGAEGWTAAEIEAGKRLNEE